MSDNVVIENDDSLLDPNRTDPNIAAEEKEIPEEQSVPSSQEEDSREVENESDEFPLPETVEEKSGLPKWAEKRLSKKDREIAELKYQIEQAQSANQSDYIAQAPAIDTPKREDFDDEDSYIDARFAYNNKKNLLEHAAREDAKYVHEREMEFRNKWMNANEEGSKKYDDFEEKTEILNRRDFPPNRAMAEAIVDSKYQLDILYFLGTYPDEARKYANLNPIQAVKKIAELESRFAAKSRSKSTTKAPPPHVPLKGNKGMAGEGDPNGMEQSDFEQWYKGKFARR